MRLVCRSNPCPDADLVLHASGRSCRGRSARSQCCFPIPKAPDRLFFVTCCFTNLLYSASHKPSTCPCWRAVAPPGSPAGGNADRKLWLLWFTEVGRRSLAGQSADAVDEAAPRRVAPAGVHATQHAPHGGLLWSLPPGLCLGTQPQRPPSAPPSRGATVSHTRCPAGDPGGRPKKKHKGVGQALIEKAGGKKKGWGTALSSGSS